MGKYEYERDVFLMYGEHWGGGAGLWPLHLFCLVIIGLLIWGAISWWNHRGRRLDSFLAGMRREEPDSTSGLDAMEVVRQRYARGEIDAITFEQMRERLEGSDRSHA